jgi:hypothetical protein
LAPPPRGSTTLLWISIDGMKGDYVRDPLASAQSVPAGADPTPYLSSLLQHSYYTRQLIPIFPSLTFPSHAAEATGTPVSLHGIPSNAFIDPVTRQKYSFPDIATVLTAEPIWLTAARQQVRTAVIDWPMSYQDALPASVTRTAYYNPRYDTKLTDAQRLTNLADTYARDFTTHPDRPPLRLLMGYIHEVDSAGHKFGPDSAEVAQSLRATDELLHTIILRVTATFDARAKPHDSLYVLLSTDHGMAAVDTAVNLQDLLGGDLPDDTPFTTAGPLALVYLNHLPPDERARATTAILSRFGPNTSPNVPRAYTPATLPAGWKFSHPTRSPDLVVLLPAGQTFTSARPATRPATKGMHGYPPSENREMLGFSLLAPLRGPRLLGRPVDLGPTDSLRLHSTAAYLLRISPSPRATRPPLALLN